MKIHLCLGTELYSLIVFNVSRDVYRRRVILRDRVIRRARGRTRSPHTRRQYTRVCRCVSHKIPSPLRATCAPRGALKAIGIIERNGEARVLHVCAAA